MGDERREYFRIDDEVTLDYRVISESEMDEIEQRIYSDVPDRFTAASNFASTSRKMKPLLQNIAMKSPDLSSCLTMLDNKLNLLAQMLVSEEVNAEKNGTHQASLSAGGLAFSNESELKVGSLMETRLVLLPSTTGILSVSRVVACDRVTDVGSDQPWRVAVEYVHIREADRDLLVKHVLSRQTEQLRAKRDAEDD